MECLVDGSWTFQGRWYLLHFQPSKTTASSHEIIDRYLYDESVALSWHVIPELVRRCLTASVKAGLGTNQMIYTVCG